jgi:DNA mismatch repair protein MSH5
VVEDFQIVAKQITDIIDFDDSSYEQRFVVRQYVDDELDEMKRVYNNLETTLSVVAEQLGRTMVSNIAQALSVIYFPQVSSCNTAWLPYHTSK